MSAKIERLFKKAYKRLDQARQNIYRKRLGFFYEFSEQELLDLIDSADSAAEQGRAHLEIEAGNEGLSEDLITEFSEAYNKYNDESLKLRDVVISRKKPIENFLFLDLSSHLV